MKPDLNTVLSKLDGALRWTGIPALVSEAMSETASMDSRHRPMRWLPIFMIACSCALFALSIVLRSALYSVALLPSLGGAIVAILPAVHMHGPLGRSSLEDDEREAALRKNSYLFCFGFLACLNCLGQPVLMILSRLLHWQLAQVINVSLCALMLNAALFGCLPTLFASWSLRPLPKE